ncbi:dephospho-CoA kinase [Spiribacter sp. C176]|uniref:Dephospho-CoA kinase n=1 Tax=Spiribacter salilacus TaxID=2664894 RepID=A0A6N7QQ67_9GAMM|nr:dephospho-CoA kinase [Spiribacter salilacus]MRH78685.1 dephospho-CoA kinase [Spiribacter salilacus]
MGKPLVIGLTGGIASGKSSVAEGFSQLGVPVIDTDAIAREVVAPGMPALNAIKARFGNSVLDATGQLNRRALRNLIFEDAQARADLEAITHPAIRDLALNRIAAADAKYVVLVVPLLIEKGWDRLVDRVLVIDAPESTQKARLMQRDGISAEKAQAIINSQADRSSRLTKADDVIHNDAALESLDNEILALHNKYLSLTTT